MNIRSQSAVFNIFLSVFLIIILTDCSRLSIKENISDKQYPLIDEQNREVTFPDDYQDKVLLVGYVYTNCPDICPLITYNMRDIQTAIGDSTHFEVVSISFDPVRDTPDVLYNYAKSYNLTLKNWSLLTGNPEHVDSLLEKLRIRTVKTPTRFNEDDEPLYFIDHTDRVTLIDKKGNIRRNYSGSELDPDTVIEDIQTLLSEV